VDRVNDWRKNGNFADVEEFVESIPFTETREYVQAIMRNAVIYKLLYSKS
jgi:soluble lytic murein transglycosylase